MPSSTRKVSAKFSPASNPFTFGVQPSKSRPLKSCIHWPSGSAAEHGRDRNSSTQIVRSFVARIIGDSKGSEKNWNRGWTQINADARRIPAFSCHLHHCVHSHWFVVPR